MSNTLKIQKDYLRSRGISEPEKEGTTIAVTYNEILEIIEPIPESQLLKIVVTNNKGIPDRILADRYKVKEKRINSIKRNRRK